MSRLSRMSRLPAAEDIAPLVQDAPRLASLAHAAAPPRLGYLAAGGGAVFALRVGLGTC